MRGVDAQTTPGVSVALTTGTPAGARTRRDAATRVAVKPTRIGVSSPHGRPLVASAVSAEVARLSAELATSRARVATLEREVAELRDREAKPQHQAELLTAQAIASVRQGDYESAVPALRTASQLGDAAATANLGVLYLNGTGVPQDTQQAIALLERAVDAGNKTAAENLGAIYEYGIGTSFNRSRAIEAYDRAALLGSTKASAAVDRLRADN